MNVNSEHLDKVIQYIDFLRKECHCYCKCCPAKEYCAEHENNFNFMTYECSDMIGDYLCDTND